MKPSRATRAGTARTAGPAIAEHQPTGAAGATENPGTTGTAHAEQPARSAGATDTVEPVAAVAEQQAPGLTVGVGCGAVSAGADQRAINQRQGGRVDRVEQVLLHGGFGARILRRTAVHQVDELLVKPRRLGTERLKLLRVRGEQRRDPR